MRDLKFRMYALDLNKMFDMDRIELPCTNKPNPASVYMQYTGLKDRNGKEIYEGDIIGLEAHQDLYVDFYEGSFVGRRINWSPSSLRLLVEQGYEVIGNIYENPDWEF